MSLAVHHLLPYQECIRQHSSLIFNPIYPFLTHAWYTRSKPPIIPFNIIKIPEIYRILH